MLSPGIFEDNDSIKPGPQIYFEPDLQPHFTHQSLSSSTRSFRLLSLFPGHGDQQLQSSLHINDLDSRPEYDALSYLWGPKEPMKAMLIDNQQFLLRPNIYSFLLRLRHPQRHRTLWLDAVCIDQINVEERSHQVSLMRYIYQSCRECLAWLGEPYDRQDEVIEVLKKGPVDEQGMADLNYLIRQLYGRQLISSFKNFMTHVYWSRVWMIQETTLPKKITLHSGGSSCLLDNMLTQVRARMFQLFQQDRIQYQQWLKVFKPSEKRGELVKLSVKDFDVLHEGDTVEYEHFPILFDCNVALEPNRQFLGFRRIATDFRWRVVVFQEGQTQIVDVPNLSNESGSSSHETSTLQTTSIVSLSNLSTLSFALENFDPEQAFRAIEVIFWSIDNTTSEQLLDERRRYSTTNNRTFTKVDFRKYLEDAGDWFCTDIRDRVFGALGVFEIWPRTEPFRADYRLDVGNLLFEVLNYCQPTDPFKLAIKLSSALMVDVSQMQTTLMEQSVRSPITVMSRIGWRCSIFNQQPTSSDGHSQKHTTVWMCRLDVPPPVEPIIYAHPCSHHPQDTDEIISIGDASIVVGVRKNLKNSVTQEEYSCVGLGWNAGIQVYSGKTLSAIATLESSHGWYYLDHGKLVNRQLDNKAEPPILRQIQTDLEVFGLLRHLSDVRVRKAAAEDAGDDGTPVLFWIELPQDLFSYVYRWEKKRREMAEPDSIEEDEMEDMVSMSSMVNSSECLWEENEEI